MVGASSGRWKGQGRSGEGRPRGGRVASALLLAASLLAVATTVAVAQSVVGQRNDALAGFGPVRFGMSIDEARQKLGKAAKAITCHHDSGDEGPCLAIEDSFLVGNDPIRVYARFTFPNRRAGMIFVDFSLPKGDNSSSVALADCEYVHDGVIRMLTSMHGIPDHPVFEDRDPETGEFGFERKATYTFKRGGKIDYSEMVLLGSAKCIVRAFYRPPTS